MSAQRFFGAGAAICAALLLAGVARAEPDQAAALFDDGVRKFKRAEYEDAASAFLRADELAPSTDALLNAIAAGRRGHAHLLVARAAQRALDRGRPDDDLSRLAREALTEAAAHLARVELSCAPSSAGGPRTAPPVAPGAKGETADACVMSIDGAKAAPGVHYMLPGTHRFAADVAGGTRDEQPLTCNAGATYAVVLHPAPSAPAPPPTASASVEAPSSGLPPPVVYAGAGVTAVLAGLTVWSGVDAIDAKNALPDAPMREQNQDVLARATRTNALFATAVVVGAATAVAAIWLVSWEKPRAAAASLGLSPSPSGATMVLRGRF